MVESLDPGLLDPLYCIDETADDTVGENIIATIKMRDTFCYPLKMIIFPILR